MVTQILSGKVKLNHEKRFSIGSSIYNPSYKDDSTIIWQINNLSPGGVFFPTYNAISPLPKFIGDSLHFKLTVYDKNNKIIF